MKNFKLIKPYELFFYVFLFLFSANFFNLESRLLVILFLIILFRFRRIFIDKVFLLLFLFSITFYFMMSFYNPSQISFYVLPYLVGPCIGYASGYMFLRIKKQDKREIRLLFLIYIIILGRFFHGFLNMIASDWFVSYVRNGVDFWTKTIVSATYQGSLITLSISLLGLILFIKFEKYKVLKLLSCFGLVLSIVNSLLTASRTALVIMAIVFAINITYLFSTKLVNRRKILFILIVFFLIVILSYVMNIFNVKHILNTSPLHDRLISGIEVQTGETGRLDMYLTALQQFIYYPFGDGTLETAHNLWLDVLKQVGWIPFALIVSFTIVSLKNVYFLLSDRKFPILIRLLVLSIVVAYLCNFFVEPIFKGMPYYFVSFCIVIGAISQYIKKKGGNDGI